MTWVSLNVVNGAMMFTLLETELQVDLNLLSFISLEDVTLLGTH